MYSFLLLYGPWFLSVQFGIGFLVHGMAPAAPPWVFMGGDAATAAASAVFCGLCRTQLVYIHTAVSIYSAIAAAAAVLFSADYIVFSWSTFYILYSLYVHPAVPIYSAIA